MLVNIYLEINTSIKQVFHHSGVLVDSGHVKNVLPVVLLTDVDVVDQLGESVDHSLGKLRTWSLYYHLYLNDLVTDGQDDCTNSC